MGRMNKQIVSNYLYANQTIMQNLHAPLEGQSLK